MCSDQPTPKAGTWRSDSTGSGGDVGAVPSLACLLACSSALSMSSSPVTAAPTAFDKQSGIAARRRL